MSPSHTEGFWRLSTLLEWLHEDGEDLIPHLIEEGIIEKLAFTIFLKCTTSPGRCLDGRKVRLLLQVAEAAKIGYLPHLLDLRFIPILCTLLDDVDNGIGPQQSISAIRNWLQLTVADRALRLRIVTELRTYDAVNRLMRVKVRRLVLYCRVLRNYLASQKFCQRQAWNVIKMIAEFLSENA
jgi:hypothetical protein